MDKKLLKNIGIALGAVLFFLVLSYAFVPQVLDGKIVNQSDISGFVGMSHEMSEWNAAHPEDPTYWTDSMFGGMPTTAISTQNGGDATQGIYNLLLTGKRPATYLFIALLGAFLLMLSLGVSWPLAIGGAVAIAFCSYNFQIIQVGHNTKMQAIAFFPWVLAALVYTYRSIESKSRWLAKVLLGAVLFGLALSLQIKANHQQITYYLAILVLLFALVEFIDILVKRKDRIGRFFIASALLLVVGGVGIATNVNKLLPLAKYTPNTMRGGSDLTQDGAVKGGGLDLDYATAWSYGWEELPNLMIPNFNGGSSTQAVDPAKSETIQLLKRAGQTGTREIAKSLPLYWGPQPFTAGPMYMGAITVFLFILGLFLYKGKEKWWLIVGTVIAILMAVGNHFMAFTKFCFNVLPLYNKFRTVSMALVVLQVTLPVLGFLDDAVQREEAQHGQCHLQDNERHGYRPELVVQRQDVETEFRERHEVAAHRHQDGDDRPHDKPPFLLPLVQEQAQDEEEDGDGAHVHGSGRKRLWPPVQGQGFREVARVCPAGALEQLDGFGLRRVDRLRRGTAIEIRDHQVGQLFPAIGPRRRIVQVQAAAFDRSVRCELGAPSHGVRGVFRERQQLIDIRGDTHAADDQQQGRCDEKPR